MGAPRFLADHNFNEHILMGVLRREPAIEVTRAREVRMAQAEDPAVLEYAATHGRITLSHDVNTMPAAAYARIEAGNPMPGLFMVRQTESMADVIESLIIIWSASDEAEWRGKVVFLPL